MDVVVLAAEETMRLDMQLDIGIAGRAAAETRHALPLQPQHLPVLGALRDRYLQRPALGQRDRARRAVDGLQKTDRQHITDILAARTEAARAAPAGAAKGAGEKFLQLLVAGKSVLRRMRAMGRAVGKVAR